MEQGTQNLLKRLERDYQPTRYPDALVEGTPRGAYDEADFRRSMTTHDAARRRVTETWTALTAAARGEQDDSSPRSPTAAQSPEDDS